MPPIVDQTLETLSSKTPHMVIIVLIIGSFIWFGDRAMHRFTNYISEIEEKEEARFELLQEISKQRIETCHAVQHDSTETIKRVADVLEEQRLAFERLSIQINTHTHPPR